MELLSTSQSPATLSLWWDGLQVQLAIGSGARSHPQPPPNYPQSLCVAVETAATRAKSAFADSENLDTLVTGFGIKCRLSSLDTALARQIKAILHPLNYYECTISDPSILHLIQLLQAEMQVPQLMNQMFVSSIVTVLTIQLSQNFQREQCHQ